MSNIGNRTYKHENYYVLLDITPSATDLEIQQAFKRLARRYHPDKKKETDDMFLRLSEAYRILTNSEFRKEYDKSRETSDMWEVHRRGYFYNSLPSCKKLSDDIIKDIEKWKKEFQEISFMDNVKEAFDEILQHSDLNKNEFKKEKKDFYCDICNQEFVSEQEHFDKILQPYVEELVSDVCDEQSAYDFLRTKLGFHELEVDYTTRKPDFVCSQDLIRQQVLTAECLLKDGHVTKANITIISTIADLEAHYNDDEDFVIDILLMIISRCFGDDLYSIGEAMKSVIRYFPTRFSDLSLVHEFFMTKYMQADTLGDWKLVLAGLHYVDKDDELLNYFTKRSIETLSNILEQAVNDSNFELLSELLSVINHLNASVLELFVESKTKEYDLERITGDYKAAILIIKGTYAKVKGEIAKSLNYFQKALQTCSESPFQSRQGISVAVMEQMSNVTYHIKVLEQLWSEFDIIKSNLDKCASLPSIAPDFVLSELFSLKLWYRQVPPTELIIAKRNEDAIKTRFKTPLAKALGYFDLSMAVGLRAIIVGLSHVLEAMRTSGNIALCYAYSKVIEKYTAVSFFVVRQEWGPNLQMYVYRLIFSLLLKSSIIFRHKLLTSSVLSANSSNTILSETGKALACVAVREIVKLVKVYPLIHIPLHSVHDQVLRYKAEVTFVTNLVHSRAIGQHHSSCFPKHLYTYQEFDIIWRGWGNSDLVGSFEDSRLNCMIDMLQTRQWKISDVEEILLWPRIRRTMHGWMNNEEVSLDFDGEPEDEVFASCRGVEINDETGEITFLFDKGDMTSLKLFSLADVKDVLVNDIDSSYLTLEDPDPTLSSHPFQEFSFRPSSMQGTDYLLTLLHADYFLKELTTGIEVNAYSPFEMRFTKDGLLQRLPPRLQVLLRPILERLRDPICPNSENAHRFWLEMESLEGHCVQSKNVVRYEFGNTKITVKTQKLKRTTSGEYIDDKDDPEISSTAEVQLAKALTKNYDEIGSYFPFLLRLKELCKISGILRILKSRATRSKDMVTIQTSRVSSNLNTNQTEMLQAIKSNVKRALQAFRDQRWRPPHPINCQVNLEHHYRDILRHNNLEFKERNIVPGETTRVRQKIREQLIRADENRFDNCAAQIGAAYKVNVAYIRPLIERWLSKQEHATHQLIEICVNGELAEEKRMCLSFLKNVESLGIQLQDSAENPQPNKRECCWVPATFCNKFSLPIELQCEAVEDPLYEDSSSSTDKENLAIRSEMTNSELPYRPKLLLCQENLPLFAVRPVEMPYNTENRLSEYIPPKNKVVRSTNDGNQTEHEKECSSDDETTFPKWDEESELFALAKANTDCSTAHQFDGSILNTDQLKMKTKQNSFIVCMLQASVNGTTLDSKQRTVLKSMQKHVRKEVWNDIKILSKTEKCSVKGISRNQILDHCTKQLSMKFGLSGSEPKLRKMIKNKTCRWFSDFLSIDDLVDFCFAGELKRQLSRFQLNLNCTKARLEEKAAEKQTDEANKGDTKPKKQIFSSIKPVRIYGGVCLQPDLKIVPRTNRTRPVVQPVEIRGPKLEHNKGTKFSFNRRPASGEKKGRGSDSSDSDSEVDIHGSGQKKKRRENEFNIKTEDEHIPEAEAKLGTSGKPTMHTSQKLPTKKAKEADFHNKGAKMKSTRHFGHRATQSDHFHPNKKNGTKVKGMRFTFGKGNTRFGWFKDRNKGKENPEPLKRNILEKERANDENKD